MLYKKQTHSQLWSNFWQKSVLFELLRNLFDLYVILLYIILNIYLLLLLGYKTYKY